MGGVESSRLPLNGTRFAEREGEGLVWTPGQGVVVVSLGGIVRSELSVPVIECLDEQRGSHRSLALFFDASRVERYESGFRIALTEHFIANRKVISSLEVFARSRLVSMGISVASLALGGLIKASKSADEFKQSLETALRDRKVIGFSPQVLGL
jgi:hypothetical protein